MTPFRNDARIDGLLLRHWQRVADDHIDFANGLHEPNTTLEEKQLESQEPYRFTKYNQSVSAPSFTPEEYSEHLTSGTWSEEETRYLMDLYNDFAGKWALITDRYDYSKPTGQRKMEDLKQRFYYVSAKVLALRTPPSQMTESEYRDHELMLKFNTQHESTRKSFKEKQMARSLDEQKEEQYLLAELKRIYAHQERFDAELRELRTRIDHSLTDDKPNGTAYATSSELTQLFQRVAQQDKSKLAAVQQQKASATSQRRSLGDFPGSAGSPTAQTPSSAHKRGSLSIAEAQTRNLTPRAEARFGVTTHERLTSGITFVGDKIAKARAATKSSVQNQKISAMLGELGVPEIVQMQTGTVCEEMERLCESIVTLLKARQVLDRTENEKDVLIKQMEMEGILKPGEVKGRSGDAVGDADVEEKEEEQDEDAVGEVDDAPAAADESAVQEEEDGEHAVKTEEQEGDEETEKEPPVARKRSASVLSAMSAGSRGSRVRKSARK